MRVQSNNTPIFGRVEPNEGNVNGVYILKRLEEALDTPRKDRSVPQQGQLVAADAREAAGGAPVGRQDSLIPRAGNQLLRSRAGTQPSCFEIWRTKLPPCHCAKEIKVRYDHHHAKSHVCSSDGSDRGGRLAPTDKDRRAQSPEMQFCKTNSLKLCGICLLRFSRLAQTARLR